MQNLSYHSVTHSYLYCAFINALGKSLIPLSHAHPKTPFNSIVYLEGDALGVTRSPFR